jgi:O-antigen ligase
VTFAFIWLQSTRKPLLLVMALIAIAIAVPRMSADRLDRYSSIFSSNTKNAASAQGRIDGLKNDLAVAMRRPIFGHGLGTSFEANSNVAGGRNVSHNLVAEVLQELGVVGLVIFGAFLTSIARGVREALRSLKASETASPLLLSLGKALSVWFAMNLLGSLFTYGLSTYSWYFLGGLAEAMTALLTKASPAVAQSRPRGTAALLPQAGSRPSFAGFARTAPGMRRRSAL